MSEKCFIISVYRSVDYTSNSVKYGRKLKNITAANAAAACVSARDSVTVTLLRWRRVTAESRTNADGRFRPCSI